MVKQVLVAEGDVMGTGQPLIEFAGAGEAVAPAAEEAVVGSGEVMKAPMGGTILEYKVKPGDHVKPGDIILVYEAMKMENNLMSDREGTIAALLLDEGEVMATDQPIIEFGVAGAKPAAPKPAPAPKPVAAPKPEAPKAAPAAAPCAVKPVDISKAYSPVEGGSSSHFVLPTGRKDNGATLKLAAGTTMEINVAPDGSIQIRITAGK